MDEIGKALSRWCGMRHYYVARDLPALLEGWRERVEAERKEERRGWYRVSDGQAMLECYDALVGIVPAVRELYDALGVAQKVIEKLASITGKELLAEVWRVINSAND